MRYWESVAFSFKTTDNVALNEMKRSETLSPNRTSLMFTDALGRAEKGGFKGGQPSFAQESVFASAREGFESNVAKAQDNISNLEMFLPQASDVGKQEIDPFLSGGEFSYLQEGFDEDYFQDLVDM